MKPKVKRLLCRAGWRAGYQAWLRQLWQPQLLAQPAGRCVEQLRVGAHADRGETLQEARPRTLTALRQGSDVLAYICKSSGRMSIFIDEGLFVDLLAWSADALQSASKP